ncbi:MAG TPA: hypothetical protein VGG62_17715 [Terracidiphilus sp.]
MGRQNESYVKGLEKMAAATGGVRDKIAQMHAAAAAKLEGDEDRLRRATIAIDKYGEALKRAAQEAKELDTQALERQARTAGMSKIGQLQYRQGELAASGEDPETIKRRSAALGELIRLEEREVAVARERKVVAIEERAEMIGKSPIEQMEIQLQREIKTLEGEEEAIRRVTAARRAEINEAKLQQSQGFDKRIEDAERRSLMFHKTRSEQMKIELDLEQKELKTLGATEVQMKKMLEIRQKDIKVQQEAEQKSSHGTGSFWNLMFRGGRDLFEGRTAYGTMDIGRAFYNKVGGAEFLGGGAAGAEAGAAGGAGLAGMSGIATAATVAIAGTTAALGATAYASLKAAESMGEYAQKVHDVQIVTGLNAREVQQFSIAAKVTGQDVSVLQRMMRGLTQAVEDTGTQGKRSREVLKGMGVDLYSLQSGSLSTMQLLDQVSSALEKQPNRWIRNKEAIELFKRAGIDSLPVLTELHGIMQETSGMGLVSQESIDKFTEINKQLTILGAEWEQFKLSFESWIAEPAIKILRFVTEDAQGAASQRFQKQFEVKMGPDGKPIAERRKPISPMDEIMKPEFLDRLTFQAQRDKFMSNEERTNVEAAERKLSDLKRTMDDLRDKPIWDKDTLNDLRKATAEWEKQKKFVESIKDAATNFKSNMEFLRKLESEEAIKRKFPYGMLPADRELMEFQARPGATQAMVERAQKDLQDRRREEASQAIQKGIAEARAEAGKVSGLLMGEPTTPEQAARQFSGEAYLSRVTEAFRKDQKVWSEGTGKTSEEYIRAAEELLGASDRLNKTTTVGAAKVGLILGPQNIETRMSEQAQLFQAAADDAREEFERKRAKISDLYVDEASREMALHALRMDQAEKEAEARNRYMEAYANEIKQQMGEIEKAVEPLYHTLFTDPKKFGSQLRSTITEAALHPIVSGLSEMTSRALHPVIFGATGTGGIAGSFRDMFGGKPDGSRGKPFYMVPLDGGGGGGAGTSIFSIGGYRGGGGTGGSTIVNLSGGGVGVPFNIPGMSPEASLALSALGIGPGGTAGFAPGGSYFPGFGGGGGGGFFDTPGGVGVPGGGGGGGRGGGLGTAALGLFSRTALGGFAKMGANLKELFGLGSKADAEDAGGEGSAGAAAGKAAAGGGFVGGLKSIAKSPAMKMAAGTAGMMLVNQGLLGESRGTSLGAFEGMVGGAGVGFAAGGPLGAAIGAGVGLTVGMAEILAGVESPRNEAKRLVLGLYRININNSAADQVVSIAKSSYGGRVSIAVRSPEVRHMLGLYAAGTGQSNLFPSGVNEAHGASLVESGGGLFQQATYQYGQAYSYGSSLPVYGGTPTHALGAPGGNVSLSLNIGGQDAARFMQGNVVSPDVISSQYAMAMQNSNGRVNQALTMAEPGSIAS